MRGRWHCLGRIRRWKDILRDRNELGLKAIRGGVEEEVRGSELDNKERR